MVALVVILAVLWGLTVADVVRMRGELIDLEEVSAASKLKLRESESRLADMAERYDSYKMSCQSEVIGCEKTCRELSERIDSAVRSLSGDRPRVKSPGAAAESLGVSKATLRKMALEDWWQPDWWTPQGIDVVSVVDAWNVEREVERQRKAVRCRECGGDVSECHGCV